MKWMLGADVGTIGAKATLISEKGDIIVSQPHEYTLFTPEENIVELDPEVYWEAFKAVTREILEKSKVSKNNVAVVSVSTQGETFVPIDKSGRPLRRAIVWSDNRSEAEAQQIEQEFGISQVYKITGQPEIVPTWPATKILWLKRNEPAVFSKAHFIRALMESIAYMMRKNLETMAKMDVRVKEIRSIGGGANSRLWGQIKSDVNKTRIITMRVKEASSLGVAVLGGVAAGIFRDVRMATDLLVKSEELIDPIPSNYEVYDEGYQKYIQLYRSLEGLFN